MKALRFIFLCLIPSSCLQAQSYPGCLDFEVTGLTASPQAGKVYVSLANHCGSCSSGLNGCVYWEMRVIRVVPPFDTVAASQCHCLWPPDNNSSRTYTLNTFKKIPPPDSLRVSFRCGQSGCDTLSQGMVVNLLHANKHKQSVLYPNPTADYITLSNLDPRIQKVVITNAAGTTQKVLTVIREKETIGYDLKPGVYYVTGFDKKGNRFPGLKFIKE